MTPLHTLIHAPLTRAEADALSARLEGMPDPPEAVSLDEVDEALAAWSLTAYFASDAAAAAAAGLGGERGILPDRDWVRQSLRGLAPVKAGRFQLHGGHDRGARQVGGVALEIDAGTAFGTGHHGTTAGCLEALDRLLKSRRPRAVLDVGCGTGVLALAAAKALRTAVLASDIDPEAVRVTLANASVNGVKPWLRAVAGAGLGHAALRGGGPYGLIFANILAGPLVALAGGLAAELACGGSLILSGLTLDQERMVTPAYRNRGLVLGFRIRRAPWSVLVFQKR